MIRGLHAMFYSSQAAELCAFFRNKLELHGTDVGGGWLICDTPQARRLQRAARPGALP